MATASSLSPAEAHDLRRRRATAQWALGLFFAAAIASMLALGYEGRFVWLVRCLPGAALCLILHHRGIRCPRCRNSVFGRRNVDENTHHPGDPGFGPGLPDQCQSCRVRLTPIESSGGGVDGNRSEVGGPA